MRGIDEPDLARVDQPHQVGFRNLLHRPLDQLRHRGQLAQERFRIWLDDDEFALAVVTQGLVGHQGGESGSYLDHAPWPELAEDAVIGHRIAVRERGVLPEESIRLVRISFLRRIEVIGMPRYRLRELLDASRIEQVTGEIRCRLSGVVLERSFDIRDQGNAGVEIGRRDIYPGGLQRALGLGIRMDRPAGESDEAPQFFVGQIHAIASRLMRSKKSLCRIDQLSDSSLCTSCSANVSGASCTECRTRSACSGTS